MTDVLAVALERTASWPVPAVSVAVVLPDDSVHMVGDADRPFALASISKMFVGWASLIAVEEGTLDLDQAAGQPGSTVRHLLAHAGGYGFNGDAPIVKPGVRRIYSNTGIELAASTLGDAAAMPFEHYLREAVFEPLGMTHTTLAGSPAYGMRSSLTDLVRFVCELRRPVTLSENGHRQYSTVQFPGLSGVVPGFGRYDDCPWGLATEIKGAKSPHWTGFSNSPNTFGHFGGAGTMLWVDPDIGAACIALTDLDFDRWSEDAKRLWPELSDAIVAAASA